MSPRRRRALVLSASLLVTLTLCTGAILKLTGFGQAVIRDSLAQVIRGQFGMSGADLDLLGGTVEIRDLDLKDPGRPNQELLTIDRVLVGISRNPLRAGALRSVTLSGISLHLRLGSGETPDLSEVLDLAGQGGGGSPPRIEIRDSSCFVYFPGESQPNWTLRRIHLVLTPAGGSGENPAFNLSGRVLAPLGTQMELSGSLEFPAHGSPRVRIEATCAELQLHPAARTGLAEVDAVLGQLEPAGTAALRLRLEYPDPAGELRGGLQATLSDFALTLPEIPYRVTGLAGSVEAWTDGNGTLSAALASQTTRASFSLEGRVDRPGRPDAHWDFLGEARSVAVDSVLRKALAAARDQRIADLWGAFEPRGGRAAARVHLKSPESGGAPAASIDLDFEGVDATFRGLPGGNGTGKTFAFPYPFDSLAGLIRIRPGGKIDIARVSGGAGGGSLQISGRIREGEHDGELDLRIEAESVPFDAALRQALAAALPDVPDLFDEYAPEGQFDAQVRILRVAGTQAARVSTEIRPRDASASFHLCPYRLDALTGTVSITPAGVAFDLQAGTGAPLVELHGRFPFREGGPGEHMELSLAASGVALDHKLRDALRTLDPGLGTLWDAFAPGGTVGFEMAATGTPGGRGPRFDIGVSLEGCTFTYQTFPAPVTDARGKIYLALDPDRIQTDLLGLAGRAWGAPITIYGSVFQARLPDTPAAMDVTIVGSGIRITESLREILHDSGFLRREIFDLVAARGRFDVVQRLERTWGTREVTASSELQLLGIESDSRLLPERASGVVGTLLASRESLDILWLEGRIGEAPVSVPNGSVRIGPETTEVALRATAPSFPVDDTLARLMDAPVDRIYLERRALAAVRLAPLDLTFSVPRKGGSTSIGFSGNFEAQGGEALLGLPVTEIEGPFSIQKGSLGQGALFVRGRFEGMRMTVSELRLQGITGAFEATEAGLRIPEAGLTLASGRVTARDPESDLLWLGFTPSRPLRAALRFQGIDLGELTTRKEGPSRGYKGSLSGTLELKIPDQDPRNIQGGLRLTLKEAFIGKVPLLGELYQIMASRSTPSFTEGKVVVGIQDGRANFSEIQLRSNFFDVLGNGSLSLSEGIDFQFKAGNLGTLLLNPLITYRLQGSLRDYRVSVESPLLPRTRTYRVGHGPVLPDFSDLPERPVIAAPGRK